MIEDRLHWIRDMDFDEDRSQIRTASAPQVMAALRNLAITIPRLAGLRQHRHPHFAATPAGRTGPTDDHELLMLTLPRPWYLDDGPCRRRVDRCVVTLLDDPYGRLRIGYLFPWMGWK